MDDCGTWIVEAGTQKCSFVHCLLNNFFFSSICFDTEKFEPIQQLNKDFPFPSTKMLIFFSMNLKKKYSNNKLKKKFHFH